MPAIAIGVGSIVGGIISSHGAKKAAQVQADAAKAATAAQAKTSSEQLALQRQIYSDQQSAQKPWQEAGTTALNKLQSGELTKPWDQKFDPNSVQLDPAFEQRLAAGNKAIERQMSARGDTLGSSTTKALARFNQDYTSEEYGNAYNRSQQQYQQAYQQFNDNQARQLGPTMALAGFGQSANAAAGQSGAQYGVNSANISQGSTAAQNEFNLQGANARASGIAGSASGYNQMVQGGVALASLYQPKKKDNTSMDYSGGTSNP